MATRTEEIPVKKREGSLNENEGAFGRRSEASALLCLLMIDLDLMDKQNDPGCWRRSGFKSPQRQLVLSFFLDPIWL